MNDNNQQNQSGQGDSPTFPPISGITPTAVPQEIITPVSTITEPSNIELSAPEIPAPEPVLPLKKKNKTLPVIIAAISIFVVVGVAGATFYISNRLSSQTALAPNAPTSEPQASGGCTDHPEKCKKTEYCKDGVCKKLPGDGGGGGCSGSSAANCQGKDPGDICHGTDVCVSLPNQTGSDGKTKCECGGGACTPTTWTPDPALTCSSANVNQTSNCGTTRLVPGTKNCFVVGKCINLKAYIPGTAQSAPIEMTQAKLNSLKINDVVLLACTASLANLSSKFTITVDTSDPNGIVTPGVPQVVYGDGYFDDVKKISTYNYKIVKAGSYKFTGQISSKKKTNTITSP